MCTRLRSKILRPPVDDDKSGQEERREAQQHQERTRRRERESCSFSQEHLNYICLFKGYLKVPLVKQTSDQLLWYFSSFSLSFSLSLSASHRVQFCASLSRRNLLLPINWTSLTKQIWLILSLTDLWGTLAQWKAIFKSLRVVETSLYSFSFASIRVKCPLSLSPHQLDWPRWGASCRENLRHLHPHCICFDEETTDNWNHKRPFISLLRSPAVIASLNYLSLSTNDSKLYQMSTRVTVNRMQRRLRSRQIVQSKWNKVEWVSFSYPRDLTCCRSHW